MADYSGIVRTNWFHVDDTSAFKNIPTYPNNDSAIYFDADNYVEVNVNESDGSVQLVCSGAIHGLIDEKDPDFDPDYPVDQDEATLISFIQRHVAEGDACILLEAGCERASELGAWATVITHDDVKYLSLAVEAHKTAQEMLGDDDWSLVE